MKPLRLLVFLQDDIHTETHITDEPTCRGSRFPQVFMRSNKVALYLSSKKWIEDSTVSRQ